MNEDPIRRFIELVLFQAQEDRATDLVIAPATEAGTGIRYQVDGRWYEMSPAPADIRPGIVAELGRMAQLPEEVFPKDGLIDVAFATARLRWRLRLATQDGECILTQIGE